MRPPSLHSNFFSSLKQVEKRLKLETPTQHFNSSPPPLTVQTNDISTESLSTPIYLHIDQEEVQELNTNCSTAYQESSSGPPLAFLSSSSQFLSILQNPHQETTQEQSNTIDEPKSNDLDDIGVLMQLLGLSDFEQRKQEQENEEEKGKERVCDECCECEGEFYEKIVGVKGPKCKKEVGRLDRWIRYFLKNGDAEPLRLAFLLLGKAAFELETGDFGGLDFPSTIDEFLKSDPPRE